MFWRCLNFSNNCSNLVKCFPTISSRGCSRSFTLSHGDYSPSRTTPTPEYDLGIVGGGIVGLGVAQEITGRYPHLKVVLLEKENELASHQTGHNSGIKEREPACQGVRAIWSPETGIVDWGRVARHYGEVFKSRGGEILTGFEADKFSVSGPGGQVAVRSGDGRAGSCEHVLTCAGLQSDRVATLSGCSTEPKIVPFRGEYLLLNPEKAKLINGNIYPVPDPRFPFLGVHFTPRMNGEVWLGPNAVLALAREGYSWGTVSFRDLKEVLLYPGFYKLGWKYMGYGLDQMLGSIMIGRAVKELQKFVPGVTKADITRGPSGVRAQAMSNAGDLVGDFIFDTGEDELGGKVLHCRNAPSPAATSSLAIARLVVDKMEEQWGIK